MSVGLLLDLDHPIGGHIDMEFIAFPRLVDELHLAEPLLPLILNFDFFDQAHLGSHRHAPGGEQQRGQGACKHDAGALTVSHGHPPVTGGHAMDMASSQDTAYLRQNPWYGWLSPTITKSRHSVAARGAAWLRGLCAG